MTPTPDEWAESEVPGHPGDPMVGSRQAVRRVVAEAVRKAVALATRDAEAPLRARVAGLEAELNRVAAFLAAHGACGYRLGEMVLTPYGIAEKAGALGLDFGFDVTLDGESVWFSKRFTYDPRRQSPHDAAAAARCGVQAHLKAAGLKAVDVGSAHDTVWGRIVEDVTP